jgi:hypothetical protein
VLREIPVVQPGQEPRRRRFADEDFDLVVWLSDTAEIVAFELCYDRPRVEQAVTWSSDHGYGHFRVDSGEETPLRNRTPILISDGSFPKAEVLAGFRQASGTLDPTIRAFVLLRLEECPL